MSRFDALGKIPADVIVVLLGVGLSRAVFALTPGSPLRVTIILGYLLLVPGYALTTAVFPAKRPNEQRQNRQQHAMGDWKVASLGGRERLAVAFGLSVTLLPLLGFLLAGGLGGITPRSVVDSATIVALVALVVGAVRRIRLPTETRYDIVLAGRMKSSFIQPPATDALLNVGLAIAVMATVTGLGYALAVPQDGNTYTSLTLLNRNDAGELVASDYPTNVSRGDGINLILLVENHEQQAIEYTVVIQLQRVSESGSIAETERLQGFSQAVPAQGSWRVRHTVSPTITGDRIRLTYLLYRDSVPPDPSRATAYRSLHLWFSVSG